MDAAAKQQPKQQLQQEQRQQRMLVRPEVMVEGVGSHAAGEYVRRGAVSPAVRRSGSGRSPSRALPSAAASKGAAVVLEIARSEQYARVVDTEGAELTLPSVGQQYWTIAAVGVGRAEGKGAATRTALYMATSSSAAPPAKGWTALKGRKPVPSSLSFRGNISLHACDVAAARRDLFPGAVGQCWSRAFPRGSARRRRRQTPRAVRRSTGRRTTRIAPGAAPPSVAASCSLSSSSSSSSAAAAGVSSSPSSPPPPPPPPPSSLPLRMDAAHESFLRCDAIPVYTNGPPRAGVAASTVASRTDEWFFKPPPPQGKAAATAAEQQQERQEEGRATAAADGGGGGAVTPHSEMLETPLSLPYQHRYFDEPTLGDGYDVLYGTAVHAGDPTTRTVPSPAAVASGVSWRCREVVDDPAIIVSVPWVRHVWHLLFDLVQPLFNMVRRTYGADEAERFFFGGAATDKSEQRDVRIWLYHRQERDSDFLPEETAEVEEGSGGGKTKYLHIERELQLAEARDRPTRVLRLLSRLPFGTKEDLDGRGLVCFRDLHVGLDPRGTPFAFGVQQRDPSEATLRPADLAAAALVGKMVEDRWPQAVPRARARAALRERRGAATGAPHHHHFRWRRRRRRRGGALLGCSGSSTA